MLLHSGADKNCVMQKIGGSAIKAYEIETSDMRESVIKEMRWQDGDYAKWRKGNL